MRYGILLIIFVVTLTGCSNSVLEQENNRLELKTNELLSQLENYKIKSDELSNEKDKLEKVIKQKDNRISELESKLSDVKESLKGREELNESLEKSIDRNRTLISKHEEMLEKVLAEKLNRKISDIKIVDKYIFYITNQISEGNSLMVLQRLNIENNIVNNIVESKYIFEYSVSPENNMIVILTTSYEELNDEIGFYFRNVLFFIDDKGNIVKRFILDGKIEEYIEEKVYKKSNVSGMFLGGWSSDGNLFLVSVGDYGWDYNFTINTQTWGITYYQWDEQDKLRLEFK